MCISPWIFQYTRTHEPIAFYVCAWNIFRDTALVKISLSSLANYSVLVWHSQQALVEPREICLHHQTAPS